MHQLIERIFATAFGLPDERERHDSAVIDSRLPGAEAACG